MHLNIHYEQIIAEERNPPFWTPDSCVMAAKMVSWLDTKNTLLFYSNVLLFSELLLKNFKRQTNTQVKKGKFYLLRYMFTDFLLITQKMNLRKQEKEKKANISTALQFVLFHRIYWIWSQME